MNRQAGLETRIVYLDADGREVEHPRDAARFQLRYDWGHGWHGMAFDTLDAAQGVERLVHSMFRLGGDKARRDVRLALGIRDWGGELRLS